MVTGIGPTTGAAQNGIQIGFGAGGAISGNTVTNNLWSPCTAVDTCAAVATNILVTQSDGVEITDNRAGISQVGIFVHGSQGLVTGNETFANSVFDGVRIEGDGNRLRHNRVFNGAESGIFVAGNTTWWNTTKLRKRPSAFSKRLGLSAILSGSTKCSTRWSRCRILLRRVWRESFRRSGRDQKSSGTQNARMTVG